MLYELGPNIWEFKYSASPMPGTLMPVRTVLIKQDSGKILIISPGPFDEATFKEIEELGEDRVLISPNMVHHMHVKQSYERWPAKPIFGQPGLWKSGKQPWVKPYLQDIKTVSSVMDSHMKAFFVRGNPFLSETVFLDERSKTLIVTDLIFNMDSTVSFGTSLMLRMVGAYNRPAQSRLVGMTTKNKEAYRSSVDKILALDFTMVIPSHGNVITDPKAFRTALK